MEEGFTSLSELIDNHNKWLLVKEIKCDKCPGFDNCIGWNECPLDIATSIVEEVYGSDADNS